MSIAFDTLKLADRLASGGFTAEQAKTAASAFSEAFTADLATKADIADLRRDVSQEIADVRGEIAGLRRDVSQEIADVRGEIAEVRHAVGALRQDLRTEIADAKTEMIKWLVGTVGFQTLVILGALVTLLKLFVK